MSRQRGQLGIIVGIVIVILVLALIGLFAVCTPGEDDHSLGKIQLASHERGRCYDEYDCGDGGEDSGGDGGYSGGHQGYGGGGGRSGDNDQRGDHNCRNFCFYGVPLPGGGGRDQPQSLIPPTPDKIIQGFQTLVDAGINLGTTITKLVTDYVVTVFRFII